MKALVIATGSILAVLIAVLAGVYLNSTFNGGTTATQTSPTTTSSSGVQGVVTGYVTVGPSQPTCPANQSCNENMSGYSLVFTPQCSGSSSNCQARTAELSPGGHYSILLPAARARNFPSKSHPARTLGQIGLLVKCLPRELL